MFTKERLVETSMPSLPVCRKNGPNKIGRNATSAPKKRSIRPRALHKKKTLSGWHV